MASRVAMLLVVAVMVMVATAPALVSGAVPQTELFFFPSECPTAVRECCPSTETGQCGGSIRGTCRLLFTDDSVCGASVDNNIGQWWITSNFDSGCVCNDNYWGVACERCKPGYTGDNCTEVAEVRIRRDFAQLSDDDKQYIIDSFITLKNTPSPNQPDINWFDYIAGSHYWSMRNEAVIDTTYYPNAAGRSVDMGHDGPSSPVFHRRMVYELERAMQVAMDNDTWSMPYWNWTNTPGNRNDEVLDWFGGDGNTSYSETTGHSCRWFPQDLDASDSPRGCDCDVVTGPFAEWPLIGLWGLASENKMLQRALGCQTRFSVAPPDMRAGNFAPTVPVYYSETNASWSFRQLLGGGVQGYIYSWPRAEGTGDMHKRIHRWLGGTLVGNSTASDPLFYMLHGFADLVLERWLRNAEWNGWYTVNNSWPANDQNIGQNRNDCTAPYLPLNKHIDWWKRSTQLGYTFDFFEDCEASGRTDCDSAVYSDPISFPSEDFEASSTVDSNYTVPTNETIFFPYICSSSNSTTCCPSYNGSVCGGDRGTCKSPLGADSACDVTDTGLAGLWWLTSSYEEVCVCEGNYWGSACEQCRPGFEGDDCMTVSTQRVRRDFATLTTAEKQVVVDAFLALKAMAHPAQPGLNAYDYLAGLVWWWRNYGATGTGTGDMSIDEGMHGAYSGPGTLTAHRRLLLEIESLMRLATGNSDFTLPYWKWDASMGNDNDATLRWFGGDGEPQLYASTGLHCAYSMEGVHNCNCSLGRGVFEGWSLVGQWGQAEDGSVLTRSFGCLSAAPQLPVDETIYSIIDMPAYHATIAGESFWRSLSGQKSKEIIASEPRSDYAAWDLDGHARVIMWMGGTQMLPEAASDPLWFMHVAYSDLLFERWIRKALDLGGYDSWPEDGLDVGHNLGECVPGFFPLQTNEELFRASSTLGYTYDYFEEIELSLLRATSSRAHSSSRTHSRSSRSHTSSKAAVKKHATKARTAVAAELEVELPATTTPAVSATKHAAVEVATTATTTSSSSSSSAPAATSQHQRVRGRHYRMQRVLDPAV